MNTTRSTGGGVFFFFYSAKVKQVHWQRMRSIYFSLNTNIKLSCFYKYYLQIHLWNVYRDNILPLSYCSCVPPPPPYVLGCGDHRSFEFIMALRKEPERGGRRAFQHMASVAMLVICSDSQVQSLFIQLALLSNPDPQFGMQCVAIKLRRVRMLWETPSRPTVLLTCHVRDR